MQKLKASREHSELSVRSTTLLTRTRVLLVDDHAILRAGIARLVDQEEDLEVCGEASSAPEALALITRLKPEIVIVDISLAGSHGIDLLKDITIRFPRLPVLMLSMHEESVYAQRCLRAGARGYLMKREPPEKLIQAIRRILQGGVYLSDSMADRMLHQISGPQPSPGDSGLARLTNREIQVLEMLGRGCSSQQIAAALQVSSKTVSTHRENLKAKLGLDDAASLVHYAVLMMGAK